MAIFSGLGIAMILFGAIWFLIEAFQESVIWGLLCFFFPVAGLVFFFVHFDKAWKPVLLQFGGLLAMTVGFFALGEFSSATCRNNLRSTHVRQSRRRQNRRSWRICGLRPAPVRAMFRW